MARKEAVVELVSKLMDKPENIRNMGIVAHVDHGKTTLSDTLVAYAGLLSEEMAGESRALDFDEQEQARGITIKAANISIMQFPGSSVELGTACGKPFPVSVMTIQDAGNSDILDVAKR